MRLFRIIFIFSVVLPGAFATSAIAQSGCIREICLTVVSQRWMTEADIKGINPLSLRRSVVRFRLTNNRSDDVVYLTGPNSVEPMGFRLSETKNHKEPAFLPDTKERTELSLTSQFGGSLKYLTLPRGSALEFDLPDWGNPGHDAPGDEHAFSVFIKFGWTSIGNTAVELVSEPFKPLSR